MGLCRGDVVLVNFNPAKGGEMGKLRPAVVMSEELDNELLDTIITIPLSTVIEPNTQPYRVHIKKREQLLQDSDACVYEVRALSKTRVKEKLTTLTKSEVESLQRCLCQILG